MKRALCVIAMAGLAGCMAHDSAPAGAAASSEFEASAKPSGISPSELSPEQVRLVQRSLADRGYAVDLTGLFDDRTQSALTEFQRARGIPARGMLDTHTLETLGIDPRDVMPVRGEDRETPATPRREPSY